MRLHILNYSLNDGGALSFLKSPYVITRNSDCNYYKYELIINFGFVACGVLHNYKRAVHNRNCGGTQWKQSIHKLPKQIVIFPSIAASLHIIQK
jgi:hypothetical protein